MNKASQLFLLILVGIALLAAYHAFFSLSATIVFGRFLGLAAFFLLCVSLLIGPLAVFWPSRFGQWIEPRRAIGITAFVFLGLHFVLELANFFNFNLSSIFGTINSLIAIPALVIFLALTLTSTDAMVRRLGNKNWKNLHRLTYLAFSFSLVHFLLNTNGLFLSVGSQKAVNFAEMLLLVLAGITVVFQIAGFLKKRQQNSKSSPNA